MGPTNEEIQKGKEMMDSLEKSLIEMFKTSNYRINFEHLGEGKYQFTEDGQPCVFDDESQFRLLVFLNSASILTDIHKHERGKEEGK
jgi:hypothetical protein